MTSSSITLSKPVHAHGEEVRVLTLREPVADDIIICGYPLSIGDGGATPQAGAIAKYIARLADIPPSSVRSLAPADFMAAFQVIMHFFGGTVAEPMTPD